ncbi:hypothetical protein HY968_04085 [Candidatus Kaiserbacteria bacterium]|nr:hypothetical protein [Candidatus Kaiserbacteria bacterium]
MSGMELGDFEKPGDAEKAFLADCEKELKEKLPDEADISASPDNQMLKIMLKDKGPYIRIVFGEKGHPDGFPFSIYRFPNKDAFLDYEPGKNKVPVAEPMTASEYAMTPPLVSSSNPEYTTKDGVEKVIKRIVSDIDKHRESFFT